MIVDANIVAVKKNVNLIRITYKNGGLEHRGVRFRCS